MRKAIELLEEALENKDAAILRELSESTRKSPEGLVPKFVYEHAPSWLGEILMAGARHYYENGISSMVFLLNPKTNEPDFGLAEMLLNRCKESAVHIAGLLEFLTDLVSEPYLEAPSSLKDEDYLSR